MVYIIASAADQTPAMTDRKAISDVRSSPGVLLSCAAALLCCDSYVCMTGETISDTTFVLGLLCCCHCVRAGGLVSHVASRAPEKAAVCAKLTAQTGHPLSIF